MLEPRINMEQLHQTVSAIGCLQEAGNFDRAKEIYYELGMNILKSCGVEFLDEPDK